MNQVSHDAGLISAYSYFFESTSIETSRIDAVYLLVENFTRTFFLTVENCQGVLFTSGSHRCSGGRCGP